MSALEVGVFWLNAKGSQSMIVQTILLGLESQLIYRGFEVIGTLHPTAQYGIFNIQSTNNVIMFVQLCYFFCPNSHYNFFDEKQIFAIFYKGELCSLLDTNNLDFVMILIAYILAVILKMINKNNKF